MAARAAEIASEYKITVREVWGDAGTAFFAHMEEEDAEKISDDPRVSLVEENVEWHLSATIPTNVNPVSCDPTTGSCTTVIDNRLWHLDRIDQNTPTPSLTQSYCTTGSGKFVYVVDTGVNKQHQEFGPGGARVLKGYNASLDGMDADDPCLGFAILPGEHLQERANYVREVGTSGHGTAVASLVGGRRVGVAKEVTIIPIKVARCDEYSARLHLASTVYVQNETMFVVDGSERKYYRALNSGTTGATAPAVWPTTSPDGVHLTVWDGSVEWQHIDENVAEFSTDNLMRGLNWILKPENNQGPKSHAVVTLSTYFRASVKGVAGPTGTVEAAVRDLLDANMTVIASANNQNGDACDTSPGRMSLNNPDGVADDVITVGGTMLVNRPWSVSVVEDTSETVQIYEADGVRVNTNLGPYGKEPAYISGTPVGEARWICGAGDSARCSNDTATSTIDPALSSYDAYNAGSNAGPCVTLFAPAKNVAVAGVLGTDDYRDPRVRGIQDAFNGVIRGNASGTSWSAPIVAGVAVRILQANPTFTPAQVREKLLENSVSTLDAATLNTYDHNGLEITGTPNDVLRDGDVNITTQPKSTAAAASGPTQLTVTAASLTSSAFTYQWYAVNQDFDYATYKSGAYASTKIEGATAATFDAPAATVNKAYWVRVSNGCSSAESEIAVVVPRPTGAPSNVVATASGANVTVTWSSGSGAEKYDVQRKVSGQPWTRAALVASGVFTFTETPSAPGGAVIYRVLSVSGEAYLPPDELASSDPSNNDFVNLNAASYEVIGQPPTAYTVLKAQHLVELRQAVNALCDAIGIAQQYTSAEVSVSSLQGKKVTASDFTTLMDKANAVRTNSLLAVGSASFSEVPAAGMIVKRSHLESLRDALR